MTSLGIALAPKTMFAREMAADRLVQPFAVEVDAGRYWLTRLLSRKNRAATRIFRDWLLDEVAT